MEVQPQEDSTTPFWTTYPQLCPAIHLSECQQVCTSPEKIREAIYSSFLDRVNLKCDYEEVKASILWSNFIIKAVHAVLENFKTYKPLVFNK